MVVKLTLRKFGDTPLFASLQREDTGQWWSAKAGGWVKDRQPPVEIKERADGPYPGLEVYTLEVSGVPPTVAVTCYLFDHGKDTAQPWDWLQVAATELEPRRVTGTRS